MKRTVGPLDKRKRVTRCEPCARRRIKCEGSSPCEYCVRTKKNCRPQQSAPDELKFVIIAPSYQHAQAGELIRTIRRPNDIVYLDYFSLFLKRCQLTREFSSSTSDLLPLIHTSPPLREVIIAIGALEASRRCSVSSTREQQSPQHVAFRSYGNSIQTLRPLLQLTDTFCRDDVLWSTFLLGLFELLSDTSGERWVKHMLYGTSRMFQLSGPTGHLSELGEKLFAAFRVLEASRAIIYGDGTFLSQESWLKQLRLLPRPADPTEMGLEVLLQASSFSKHLFEQIETIPDQLRPGHPMVMALASEGSRIKQALASWYATTAEYLDHQDPCSQLPLVNYHALHLFLGRNFTFYSCWKEDTVPTLTEADIGRHVTAILALSNTILETSAIPGLLLLFPLRMAGANAVEVSQRDTILDLLARASQRGFLVSERIKVDLLEWWEYQDFVDFSL